MLVGYIGIILYVFVLICAPLFFPYFLICYNKNDKGAILVLLLSSLALLLYKPKDYSPYVSSILYLLRFVLIGLPFAFKHVYDDQKNKVKIIPYAFIVICNFILLFS